VSGGARRACIPEPPRIWEGGVVYGPLLGAGKSCTTHPLLRAGGRGRPLVRGGFDSGEGTPPPFARLSSSGHPARLRGGATPAALRSKGKKARSAPPVTSARPCKDVKRAKSASPGFSAAAGPDPPPPRPNAGRRTARDGSSPAAPGAPGGRRRRRRGRRPPGRG